jgi:hypothetical protein
MDVDGTGSIVVERPQLGQWTVAIDGNQVSPGVRQTVAAGCHAVCYELLLRTDAVTAAGTVKADVHVAGGASVRVGLESALWERVLAALPCLAGRA